MHVLTDDGSPNVAAELADEFSGTDGNALVNQPPNHLMLTLENAKRDNEAQRGRLYTYNETEAGIFLLSSSWVNSLIKKMRWQKSTGKRHLARP